MKKYLLIFSLLLLGISSSGNGYLNIDEQLVRSFNNLFPFAQHIKWNETPDTYIVHFTDGGIQSRITYYKESSLINFTRYYLGEHLPFAIQIKLKKDYHIEKVIGVTEISTYSDPEKPIKTEYYINVEYLNSLLIIKVKRNGKFVVLEKFRKAS